MTGAAHAVMLFADLVGSTALYERLGNDAARAVVARSLSELAACVQDHRGQVIKHIGDAVMASFAEPSAAIDGARAMQAGAQLLSATFSETIAFRIGLAWGPVLISDNDVFGDTVNVAARIADLAKAGKIYLNEALYLALPELQQDAVRLVDIASVKGKSELQHLYEFIWESRDVTLLSHSSVNQMRRAITVRLQLQHLQRCWLLESTQLPYLIGRGEQCQLQLSSPLVSRQHARIELRRGLLYVVDHSTNGTWLRRPGHDALFLHNEHCLLDGEGQFSLGDREFAEPKLVLQYREMSGRDNA